MGYTHYVRATRTLTPLEWEQFTNLVRAVFETTTVPLSDGTGVDGTSPFITQEQVNFNGVGDDSHENCAITRTPRGVEFCKTAQKPYDAVVGAVYLLYQEIHGGEIISSDGDMSGEEWDDARDLRTAAKLALNPSNSA